MTAPEELDFVSWAEVAAPRLRRLGFLITGDWHLAEDLTQDALIRIYSVWGRVSRTGSPNAYASRVLVNLNRSWVRVARNREWPSEDLPERPEPLAAVPLAPTCRTDWRRRWPTSAPPNARSWFCATGSAGPRLRSPRCSICPLEPSRARRQEGSGA
jgi:DNA-directed RNA polymerase specialized sigma24 family protein